MINRLVMWAVGEGKMEALVYSFPRTSAPTGAGPSTTICRTGPTRCRALPAASRPSKTMTMRAPVSVTYACRCASSTCSRASSVS